MGDPIGFLKHARAMPERRPPEERVRDWREMYRPFPEESCKTQGVRCMDCGVAFCNGPQGCPVSNYIPDWNDLVSRGRWKEALKSLHRTNNFPEFTGRLCPAPCETACVLGIDADPVAIRAIEWNIADRGFLEGWVEPLPAPKPSGKKVAIVGSGPAGLAAAQQLARLGHAITVFERADRPGGLLRYGIPDFKMEKWVLDRRLAQLRAEGVAFQLGTEIGRDLPAEALLRDHDAVGLAVGAEEPRDLRVPGRELAGVHFAMDYLVQANRMIAGDRPAEEGRITAAGKRVVVIGGGDTGSDCIGTAHRQGCVSLTQLEILPRPPESRSPTTPWPSWPLQIRTSHAHEEGGERRWSTATVELLGEGGRVTGLRTTELQNGQPVAGRDHVEPVDLVLLAMGFTGPRTGGLLEQFRALGVRLDARGNVATDSIYRTSLERVYCAGDARRGASLIVWAIAEGRKMAETIDRSLADESRLKNLGIP